MKNQEVLIAHPTTETQMNLLIALLKELNIKFEFSKEKPYDPTFVAKIEESTRQANEVKLRTVT
jgi:hypothetical protein